MCEITGVKGNRLNYIVITQTLFYNYLTLTSLKSFYFKILNSLLLLSKRLYFSDSFW